MRATPSIDRAFRNVSGGLSLVAAACVVAIAALYVLHWQTLLADYDRTPVGRAPSQIRMVFWLITLAVPATALIGAAGSRDASRRTTLILASGIALGVLGLFQSAGLDPIGSWLTVSSAIALAALAAAIIETKNRSHLIRALLIGLFVAVAALAVDMFVGSVLST